MVDSTGPAQSMTASADVPIWIEEISQCPTPPWRTTDN